MNFQNKSEQKVIQISVLSSTTSVFKNKSKKTIINRIKNEKDNATINRIKNVMPLLCNLYSEGVARYVPNSFQCRRHKTIKILLDVKAQILWWSSTLQAILNFHSALKIQLYHKLNINMNDANMIKYPNKVSQHFILNINLNDANMIKCLNKVRQCYTQLLNRISELNRKAKFLRPYQIQRCTLRS